MSARRPTARVALPFFTMPDHAGLAQAAVDRDAPVGERLGDHVGGALLLEAQLGVGVDVAAHRGDLRGVGEDGFDQLHGGLRGERRPRVVCRFAMVATALARAPSPGLARGGRGAYDVIPG